MIIVIIIIIFGYGICSKLFFFVNINFFIYERGRGIDICFLLKLDNNYCFIDGEVE